MAIHAGVQLPSSSDHSLSPAPHPRRVSWRAVRTAQRCPVPKFSLGTRTRTRAKERLRRCRQQSALRLRTARHLRTCPADGTGSLSDSGPRLSATAAMRSPENAHHRDRSDELSPAPNRYRARQRRGQLFGPPRHNADRGASRRDQPFALAARAKPPHVLRQRPQCDGRTATPRAPR